MADYGIKVTKAGYSATDTPTDATKKNYTILSTDGCLLVKAQAVVASDTNVTHSLGFGPLWDAYTLSDSLTRAHPTTGYWNDTWYVSSDATYLYCDEIYGSDSLFYIYYYNQA